MGKRDTYNTKQKDIILKLIKQKPSEFTIKDLYKEVKTEVGLTTYYRLIDQLLENGEIKKIVGKNNITYYQYLERCNKENHFYLKCNKCGKIIHIDCDCINDLSSHILKKHRFTIEKEHIMINGLCSKCQLKENKSGQNGSNFTFSRR